MAFQIKQMKRKENGEDCPFYLTAANGGLREIILCAWFVFMCALTWLVCVEWNCCSFAHRARRYRWDAGLHGAHAEGERERLFFFFFSCMDFYGKLRVLFPKYGPLPVNSFAFVLFLSCTCTFYNELWSTSILARLHFSFFLSSPSFVSVLR